MKLLCKLPNIGIDGKVVSWISAYLFNCTQFVKANSAESECLEVFSGVTQESVLGPTLFLMYVSDMYLHVEIDIALTLLADDCVIYKTIRTERDQVQLNLSLPSIAKQCDEWGRQINVAKTACMSVTRKKKPLVYTYNLMGSSVARAESYK